MYINEYKQHGHGKGTWKKFAHGNKSTFAVAYAHQYHIHLSKAYLNYAKRLAIIFFLTNYFA